MKPYSAAKKGIHWICSKASELESSIHLSNLSFSIILLSLQCLLRPYRGLVHDARLYALQALNNWQNDGFSQDLFFAFGSQDSFSIFSAIVGPLVGMMGIQVTFWLAYLLASLLFIYAAVSLIRKIIPGEWLATLSLLALAVSPLPYGGWEIFHVQESFFTARLIAEAFLLLGILAVIESRKLKAFVFLSAGIALHMLMGVGVLAVVFCFLVFYKYEGIKRHYRLVLPGLCVLSVFAVIYGDSIRALIPYMSDAWYSAVRTRNYPCFPSQWHGADWYRICGSTLLCIVGSKWLSAKNRSVVWTAVAVGLAGTVSSVIGEALRNSVLIGGQGFRAFWLVEILALPLGVLSVHRLFICKSVFHRWFAFGTFIVVSDPLFLLCREVPISYSNIVVSWILICIAAEMLISRRKIKSSVDASPLLFVSCYAVASIVSIAPICAAAKIGMAQNFVSPIDLIHAVSPVSSRTLLAAISTLYFIGVLYLYNRYKQAGVVICALWIAFSVFTFHIQNSQAHRQSFQKGFRDVAYVSERIKSKGEMQNLKYQVYWPNKADLIWFDLDANSYFSYLQLAGALFSEELTLEGQRRLILAKPFEISWINGNPVDGRYRQMVLASVNSTGRDAEPGRRDLLRLASDPLLDWIVLDKSVQGIEAETNGSVYVYNCAKIRHKYPLSNGE